MRSNHKKVLVIFLLAIVAYPAVGLCDLKEIISEGTYNMGDGETPSVAEERALLAAKRTALEQAGTYVLSYSRVNNFELTDDEIKVLSSGIMEVTVLGKKRKVVEDGFRFWVKIRAIVKTDRIKDMAGMVKDKNVIDNYKNAQLFYDKNQQDVDRLKDELIKSQGKKKKETESKIAKDEKLFKSNRLFEDGNRYFLNKDYEKAISSYTKSIELCKSLVGHFEDLGQDFSKRYDSYYLKGQRDWELDRLKEWGELLTASYFNRGQIYYATYKNKLALEDFSKAITGQPDFSKAYVMRAEVYTRIGQLDLAFQDANKAISLDPTSAQAYHRRGSIYAARGDVDNALQDYNRAIKLDPRNPDAYAGRGGIYFGRNQNQKAQADLRKACDLGSKLACGMFNVFFPQR